MPPSPQPIKFSDREAALRNLMSGKPLPRPANGSDKLWAVVKKATEYKTADRFASPTEMRILLDSLLAGDTLAGKKVVIGAEGVVGLGQYSDTDPTQLPDGPGTAILDLVGGFGDDDATIDIATAKRIQAEKAAAASAAASSMYQRYNTPVHTPPTPPSTPKKKKDGVGIKLLIGLIFVFILLLFFIFVGIGAFSNNDNDEPDNEEIVENEVVEEEPIIEDTDTDAEEEEEEDVTPTKINLSESTLELEIGDKHTLEASVSPSGAEMGKLKWTSSDEDVATVNKNGKITAVGSGMAGITVTMDGLSATCTVTVKAPATVTGIEIASPPSKTEYVVGESLDTEGLAIQVNYSDGSTEVVTDGFNVSTEPFETAGIFNITISYSNYTASFTITVTEPAAEPEPPAE